MAEPTYDELLERTHDLEIAMQAREAQYERLFQNTAMGILLVDQQSTIVDANRQALCILGYTRQELLRISIPDLVHPDDINAQPIISIQDMVDLDRGMTLERHYRGKDGRYIPVEVNLHALTRDILIVIFQDISQRKRVEDALYKANEALEVLYHSAQAAIVGMDSQKRVTFWNPAAEKLFGWAREEVLGRRFDPKTEPWWESYNLHFAEVMAGKTVDYLEVQRKRKDGTELYVGLTAGPLRNENKEVFGLISIMFDITQRKQAEKALQQSEQRYRSLVENTQDGYFVCELPSGRFLFLNQSICELLGYDQEEACGLTFWDIVVDDDHERLKKVVDRFQNGTMDVPGTGIYRARRKDGAIFRAEISAAPVTFDEKPSVQGLLRDITEKERLQHQLQQAQRLESIGTLAGGVAHDFNNLLMAILGNTTLAKLRIDAKHPAFERLDNIINYVQDASALTRQLLEFARGGKYEAKATDLNALVRKTVQMFGRTKKEIAIETLLHPDLWVVEVDQGQIEQVLLNLLVNAWQAMPDGGQVTLETSNAVLDKSYCKAFSVSAGNYVRVTVTDTGIGMDKAIQTKIFEPFYTTKDRGRGTGLGLASAYGIIKNHDGIITVYSETGKGAKFCVHLPAVEASVVQAEAMTPEITLQGSETILLVDDEGIILEVGRSMLAELGYHPLTACSGQEALNIYMKEKGKIDLVILDMIMPVMSGSDTYDRLKDLDADIKILLSSGYSITGEASRILKKGCNGFIQKPFNIEELSCKIREVLDSKMCVQ